MIGTIIGDIAGSRYEFDNTSDYDFQMFTPEHGFTDDTVCTMAVADTILNHKGYEETMRQWCLRYPTAGYGRYFRNWVIHPDSHPYNSFGNGSAMRVAPVGWLFQTEEDVRTQAAASAAITHNHPEGIRGAVAVAVAIFRMRMASDKDAGIYNATAKEFYGDNVFAHLPKRGCFDVTCQGCVPLSLYLAARATGFEDAVRRAVAYGGDSDTIGAITGALAEARHQVPPELAEKAKTYLPGEMLAVLNQFETSKP